MKLLYSEVYIKKISRRSVALSKALNKSLSFLVNGVATSVVHSSHEAIDGVCSIADSGDLRSRVHQVMSVTSTGNGIVNVELHNNIYSWASSILKVFTDHASPGSVVIDSTLYGASHATSMTGLPSLSLIDAMVTNTKGKSITPLEFGKRFLLSKSSSSFSPGSNSFCSSQTNLSRKIQDFAIEVLHLGFDVFSHLFRMCSESVLSKEDVFNFLSNDSLGNFSLEMVSRGERLVRASLIFLWSSTSHRFFTFFNASRFLPFSSFPVLILASTVSVGSWIKASRVAIGNRASARSLRIRNT